MILPLLIMLALVIPGPWDDSPATQECRHRIAIRYCGICNR